MNGLAATVLGAAGLGLGLGAITGMPLGVVNVAIADAASAGRRRFAIGLGLGGAIADTVHAALAFVGVGSVIAAHRDVQRALAIVAGVVVVAYAVHTWRVRAAARGASVEANANASLAPSESSSPRPGSVARGIATGIALTLPNPGALAAWVTVAAAIWPGAPIFAAAVTAIGVGVGSATWFTLLARWIANVRPDHPVRRVIPTVALVALVALAAIGVIRSML